MTNAVELKGNLSVALGTPGAGCSTLLVKMASDKIKNGEEVVFMTSELESTLEKFKEVHPSPNLTIFETFLMDDAMSLVSLRHENHKINVFLDGLKFKQGTKPFSNSAKSPGESLKIYSRENIDIVMSLQVNRGILDGRTVKLSQIDEEGNFANTKEYTTDEILAL